MKTLSYYVLGFSLATCTVCYGQIDIYQSDAYSVEEMCAREAEQNTAIDYADAYESCIRKNSGKPMYQSESGDGVVQSYDESDSDNIDQIDTDSQNQSGQDSPQD